MLKTYEFGQVAASKLSVCPILLCFIMSSCFLSSCGPSKPKLSDNDVERIVTDGRAVAAKLKKGDCDSGPWPDSIRILDPETVCRSEFGLMIQVWSFFVQARGYLVLLDGTAVNTSQSQDPSFGEIGESLYWFNIKG